MARRKKRINEDSQPNNNPRWMWMLIGLLLMGAIGYFAYTMLVSEAPQRDDRTVTEPPIALEGEAALDRIAELNRDELLPLDERWEKPLLEGDYNDARRQLESLLSNTLEMSEFTRHAYFLGLLYLYMPKPDRNLDRAIEYLEVGKSFRSDAILYIIKAQVEAGRLQSARDILQNNPALEAQLPETLVRQVNRQEKEQ